MKSELRSEILIGPWLVTTGRTVWSSRGYWGCVWAPVEKVDLGLGVKEFSEFWDALKNCDGLYFGYGKEPTEWETLG